MEYIPVVDLSKITKHTTNTTEDDLLSTADEIFKALSGIGFVYLKNHGIQEEIINAAFKVSREFFQLPQDVKDKCEKDLKNSFNNGYSKKYRKRDIRFNQDNETQPIIRELYDLNGDKRFHPKACPEFEPALQKLEEACKPLTKTLLRILAISLKLDDKEFFIKRSKYLDDSNVESYTVIRSLYYPSIPENIPAGAVRCAEHTDYGILTLLFQDDIGGLEVKSVSGKWVLANPIPGTILLNTGDLLEFWSGGKFPATHHQVLIPEEEVKQKIHCQRQALAYFVHPDDNVSVSPLTGNYSEYATISAVEHAKQKLAMAYKY